MHSKKNQQGMVSIVITIILMVVITLIVLSFAKISRREQRNALDRQLSTQAFYAAESGVNDARAAIDSWVINDGRFSTDYTDSCTTFAAVAGAPVALATPLVSSSAASYTCLFVDASPNKLIYAESQEQRIIPVRNRSGAINTIEIYWDNGNANGGFTGCLPVADHPAAWPANCDAPILRVELVDSIDFTSSKAFFMYPNVSIVPGTISYALLSGEKVQANCAGNAPGTPFPNRCKIQITNLGGSQYYLRVKALYDQAALTITANDGVAQLVGAQTMIDSTGKASDVERRIQVRVNLGNQTDNVPTFGLEGTDKICKKFTLNGSTATDQASPLCWTAANTPN